LRSEEVGYTIWSNEIPHGLLSTAINISDKKKQTLLSENFYGSGTADHTSAFILVCTLGIFFLVLSAVSGFAYSLGQQHGARNAATKAGEGYYIIAP